MMMLVSGHGAILALSSRSTGNLPSGQIFAVVRDLVEQVDAARLELRVVLVQRDQHLMAERRQRMEIERQGHRGTHGCCCWTEISLC